ncbi:MAG: hypothetical protein AAB573_02185 [Patescibacteria group bacterium]
MAKGQLESKFGEKNQPEKFSDNRPEALPNVEAIRTVKGKAAKTKRSRQRAAAALAASNAMFSAAVLELQGLGFLPREDPHEFLITKLLPEYFKNVRTVT